ncbi:MAG: Smr/MutS family protein [Casimicrobiaceae bacterium]
MAKLSDLKAVFTAARAKETQRAPEALSGRSPATITATVSAKITVESVGPAANLADEELDLQRAFADVRKLPRRNQATLPRLRPTPVPLQTLADERDVLAAAKYGDEATPHAWEIGQEFEHEQTFVRAGIGSDVLSKLRRGHWSVQSELDLHGYTTGEARDALADFLFDARSRRYRCVRVIHGKGLTSPNKEPVLKGKVRRWLTQWGDVLAFAEAPLNAGGGGAVLVLLRGS